MSANIDIPSLTTPFMSMSANIDIPSLFAQEETILSMSLCHNIAHRAQGVFRSIVLLWVFQHTYVIIMITSISKRIKSIKKLVNTYINFERGVLIDKHLEQLRVFSVRGSINKKHPHKNKRVYISRRALKHFVESRKEELGKHHTKDQVSENIYFAIEHLQETVVHFEHYEYTPPRNHFYTKNYHHVQKSKLRVLVEENNDSLEIISIHFRK